MMRHRSLRAGLLQAAALWTSLALLLAGLAIHFTYVAHVERGTRDELQRELDHLVGHLGENDPLASAGTQHFDARYELAGGGAYWQLEDLGDGAVATSESLWDVTLATPTPAAPGELEYATLAGPNGQSLAALTRDVRFALSDRTLMLRATVALDRAGLDRDIGQFGVDIAAALLAVAASLIVASWLQVQGGLRPLGRLGAAVDDVAEGRAARLPDDFPAEVQPLVQSVNALLDGQERSVAFARARADDLAHGLKTPLSVLGATAARLRDEGDTANAGTLDLLATEMGERIDYQLRLAQLRLRPGFGHVSAALDAAVLRSVAVLRRTGGSERLEWRVETVALSVALDPHDLMELVGVVLENAARWANSRVEITCRSVGDIAELTVADDGPGLPDADLAGLGTRGGRLDEQRSGTGIGLAIAREILALNGGRMTAERSASGGLGLTLTLPLRPPPAHP
jgi:signal transduction histidine kinase